ncbi:MAG: cupredoxin domain-containing protein [Myxococcaceae bacterium]|nr:MAG: cupredoxin domain-containing protein [Myxococcaceae bacterium]
MNRRTIPSLLLLASLALAGCNKAAPTGATGGRRVAIAVGEQGYSPASVTVPAAQPVTLVFTRTSDQGCGTQVVFPSLNIRRDLPLNQPVEVTLTPAVGTIAFTCGMNMLRGSVVAQ